MKKKENEVHFPCELCGNPNGDKCFYYTAKRLGTSASVNQVQNTVSYSTSYANLTKHEGFVCKACRRKGPRKTLWKYLVFMVGCILALVFFNDTFFGKSAGNLQIILGLSIVFGIVIGFAGVIGGLTAEKPGSDLLVEHYKRKPNSAGATYFTHTEALKLQRR